MPSRDKQTPLSPAEAPDRPVPARRIRFRGGTGLTIPLQLPCSREFAFGPIVLFPETSLK